MVVLAQSNGKVWDEVSWNPTDALPIAPLVLEDDEGESEYEKESRRRKAWPARIRTCRSYIDMYGVRTYYVAKSKPAHDVLR